MNSPVLRAQLQASLIATAPEDIRVAEHLILDAADMIINAARMLDKACRCRAVEPKINAIPNIEHLELVAQALSAIADPS